MSIPVNNNPDVLPEVPSELQSISPALYDYLQRQKLVVEQSLRFTFQNLMAISTAANAGTTGTFAIASGGHITVSNGFVTSVSTT